MFMHTENVIKLNKIHSYMYMYMHLYNQITKKSWATLSLKLNSMTPQQIDLNTMGTVAYDPSVQVGLPQQ